MRNSYQRTFPIFERGIKTVIDELMVEVEPSVFVNEHSAQTLGLVGASELRELKRRAA